MTNISCAVTAVMAAATAPQLPDTLRTFEGKSREPSEAIRKNTRLFLAGYYLHLEKAGAFVQVDAVPAHWSPRYLKPGWIDDAMFIR